MIQTVTTVADSTCTNCGEKIVQGKGDLEATLRWWHLSNGHASCPNTPEADPGHNPVHPRPEMKVYQATWHLEKNGSVHDWVARCDQCQKPVARHYSTEARPPDHQPVHIHWAPAETRQSM